MKYLIAALGNIGPEYHNTRHNIGFMLADEMAAEGDVEFSQGRHVFKTSIKRKGKEIIIIKPTTYMNLSGKAVRYWLQEEKIPIQNLLVVTDDISLPFDKIRMKPRGSHGGHNGLRNIAELLGTDEYPRLRIGVGNDFPKGRQVEYVLSPFNKEQMDAMPLLLDRSAKAVFSFIDIGLERTMNFFN